MRRGATLAITAAMVLAAATPASAAAPNTRITSGPSGLIAKKSATFGFTSKPRGATFQCRMDAGAWASCTSPKRYTGLSQGSHTFRVRARKNGVVDPTPARRSFTVDTVKPQTTILTGPSGLTDDHNPSFTFSSTEPGTFTCRLTDASFEPCTSPFTPASPLPDDSYLFEARARDLAGNADPTPASRAFDVETPITKTLQTATAAADLYLSDGLVLDVPASCPEWDCPDGEPLPAADQLSIDLLNRTIVEQVGANRYDVTNVFDVTTLESITFTYGGVTCDVTLTPSDGVTPSWTFQFSLQFQHPPDSTEWVITAINPALSNVEAADLAFSGNVFCALLETDLVVGTLADGVADLLIERVGSPLCAAPGPDYLGPCPPP